MNENLNGNEYDFKEPLIQKIDSLKDNCIKECHNRFFHTLHQICENDNNFKNITNNETVNFTIYDKSMGLLELNKKLTVARGNGFIFNQMNKLTIKIYSNLAKINIHYYLKLQIPIMHRHFFRGLSENPEYIQTHCNVRNNPFQIACRQWFSYNNPQRW